MHINSGTSRRSMPVHPELLHTSNILQHAEHSLASSASLSGTTSTLVAEESDSELGPSSRSRQKKFLKTFKQLPQEEQVLQSMIHFISQSFFMKRHADMFQLNAPMCQTK
jgi:hypothetical protein